VLVLYRDLSSPASSLYTTPVRSPAITVRRCCACTDHATVGAIERLIRHRRILIYSLLFLQRTSGPVFLSKKEREKKSVCILWSYYQVPTLYTSTFSLRLNVQPNFLNPESARQHSMWWSLLQQLARRYVTCIRHAQMQSLNCSKKITGKMQMSLSSSNRKFTWSSG
jgi:hypothetical protein